MCSAWKLVTLVVLVASFVGCPPPPVEPTPPPPDPVAVEPPPPEPTPPPPEPAPPPLVVCRAEARLEGCAGSRRVQACENLTVRVEGSGRDREGAEATAMAACREAVEQQQASTEWTVELRADCAPVGCD